MQWNSEPQIEGTPLTMIVMLTKLNFQNNELKIVWIWL